MTRAFQLIALLIVGGALALVQWLDGQPQPAPIAAAAPATPGESWAVDLLIALGNAQPSTETISYLEAWHRAEGGTASFNWLNTTQSVAGATDYNSVGVKNYPDYETGIQATAETLQNGFYPNTLAGLASNQPIVDDGEMGTWGTGGGAIRAQLAQAPDDARAALVTYALSLQGIPYVRGGRSASGGDCSGTMEHIYLQVTGIDIGGTTFSQYPGLQPVDEADLQSGDLWYGQYSDDQHTGMIADVDGNGRWDLINNGGLASDMHVDYDFLSMGYFNQHTMGFRRAL